MRRGVLVAAAAPLALSACATTHTVGAGAAQPTYAVEVGVAVDGSADYVVGQAETPDSYTGDDEPWTSPLLPPGAVRLTRVQATPVQCPPWDRLGQTTPNEYLPRLAGWQHLAAVVMCSSESRRVPGDGVWSYTVTMRATTRLARVERALRQPDVDTLPPMSLCPTSYEGTPWVAVVTTTGRVLRPYVPQGACGGSRVSFDRAIQALTWVRYEYRRDKRSATEAALGRHPNAYRPCPTSMPDVLARRVDPAPLAGREIPVPPEVNEYGFLLCQFTPGTGRRSGRLVLQRSVDLVSSSQRDAVTSGLALVTDVRPCRRAHSDIVTFTNSRAEWIAIERDGCRRVLTKDGIAGQASPELLRAVGVRL